MPLKLLAALVAGAVFSASATASDALVAELEQRVSTQGVDKVNEYLSGSFTMLTLNDSTARCELPAVSLSIQLARGSRSKAVDAHREALRAAAGSCTGFVLALLSPKEVPTFCASAATWSVSQMARELRRRIKRIEADELLRSTQRGKACRAAYLYELNNTRVGLRVGPASSAPPSR